MKGRVQSRTLFAYLTLLCLLAVWLSLALGPVSLPLFDTLRAGLRLLGVPVHVQGLEQAEMILGQIRLPRTLLGLAVGAVLALSGVTMQGLFRNPLADPGLVGVASGAALGAAVAIVGGSWQARTTGCCCQPLCSQGAPCSCSPTWWPGWRWHRRNCRLASSLRLSARRSSYSC